MGKYLKEFELTSQYEEYINSTMALLPNVSLTNDDNMIHYNPYKVSTNYLTFTAEEDNSTISLSSANDPDIKYSLNGGEWTQWDYSAITLNTGDTVRMKGNNSNGFSTGDNYSYNQFQMTGKIGASGNIMSLLYDDDFEGKLTIPCDYCFGYMFYLCDSLTTAPELPATTLTMGCYESMFDYCTSLTTAPELPATILAEECYYNMFNYCTSLTIAPELPATILVDSCYQFMFHGCNKLNYIKMLATDINAYRCLYMWVYDVASTGTFVKHLDMTILPTGVSGIPEGWNVEDNVIEIDYKKFSIINNSNNNEIIFYHNDGIYSSVNENHIDLSGQYDETTIYSFTPEINLIINIYKVSQDNVGVLKSANAIWESATSLEELCNIYNINDLDGILIIIKSVDDNYNDGYGYYDSYDYYDLEEKNYLSFTAEEDNSTISLSSANSPDIKYSLNGGEWTQWDYSAITLNTGDTVRMKGNNSNGFSTSSFYNKFQMTGKIGASGNIMSLLYEDDFEGNLTIPCAYCFSNMFDSCTSLVTTPELPATTLTDYCYREMFRGCSSLTTTPELPATTLADYCYQYMFQNCTSLTTTPELPATTLASNCYQGMFHGCISLSTVPAELPATTLADHCYQYMFQNCTSLTTTPALPATTLADYCYYEMFGGCTSLTTTPELPATTLAVSCYGSMFSGCTSLITTPELPATTLINGCYSGMFTNCTSLTTTPELPATTLAERCYSNMFQGCTSLTTAPDLPTTKLAESCYWSMFSGCTSLTAAPELPATTLAWWCYYNMFAGCTKLNYIKMLATNISATGCLNSWVNGVASTGTFVKHADMTSLPTGTSGIPSGWTVEDAA